MIHNIFIHFTFIPGVRTGLASLAALGPSVVPSISILRFDIVTFLEAEETADLLCSA